MTADTNGDDSTQNGPTESNERQNNEERPVQAEQEQQDTQEESESARPEEPAVDPERTFRPTFAASESTTSGSRVRQWFGVSMMPRPASMEARNFSAPTHSIAVMPSSFLSLPGTVCLATQCQNRLNRGAMKV